MAFTLIVGPMKSGKSLELIARVAPYKFASKQVLFLQPHKNIRDDRVASRAGINVEATKVDSLRQVDNTYDVIGVDEAHMFSEDDVRHVSVWLREGKEVIMSGLDLDYRGRLIPFMRALLELKPDVIISKVAVCDSCRTYGASFTQIIHNKRPVTKGLPAVVPEDGTYDYHARCRNCFVRPNAP
jgi:thymidine kinase